MIRAKLYKGLLDGTMNMRSIFDDEKVKLKFAHGCSYCGVNEKLQIDHLIPKVKFGSDSADNLVWACRSCNSSKGGRDLLRWLETKNRKPSILLLRRYLKLISLFCEENELMDSRLDEIVGGSIPFDLLALPYKLEPLSDYVLWIGEN